MNTLSVLLIQFATEMMKYALANRSRKENLTKDDIPTIFEPVNNTVQAYFPLQQDFKGYTV